VFPPIPEELRELVAKGGTRGWLSDWWGRQKVNEPA
jgi:hypothetical protein